MSNQSPSLPPVIPSSGNAKYVLIAVVLIIGIAALIAWRTCGQAAPPPPPVTSLYDAAPTPHDDDLVPPPPPPPEQVPEAGGIKYVYVGDPCTSAKTCSGTTTSDLETAIGFRAKQAHRCYDQALASDDSLKGHVTIKVRVASNGRVCSANIAENDMGTDAVAKCVQARFVGAGMPAPKGNCVDVNVPLYFHPGGK